MVSQLQKANDRANHVRPSEGFVREPASSGPLYLAPVSPKSSKNTRSGREKRMFFELFADTGAKKRGPELAGSLIRLSRRRSWSHRVVRGAI